MSEPGPTRAAPADGGAIDERELHRLALGAARAELVATVTRYAAALEAGDADALVALLTADVTWAMPPSAVWFRGTEAVRAFLHAGPLAVPWRHLPARANGQLAVGCYRWEPEQALWLGAVLDVLALAPDGRIAEVTAFIGPEHLATAGLPATLPADTPPTRTVTGPQGSPAWGTSTRVASRTASRAARRSCSANDGAAHA